MTANPFAALLAGVPDYDAGLLNDYGGGNTEWWQDYIRAEIGRANDAWRENVLAALAAAYPADLAEAVKLVEGLRELGHLHMLGRCLSSADMITALLARIAAQEAQIKGLKAEKRYWQGEIDTVLAGRADEHDRAETAEAKLAEWKASQHYRYIGADGQPVLARDLEARAEAAETALAAERVKVAKLVEALGLADAALSGANMDMKHVWRKIKAALAEGAHQVDPAEAFNNADWFWRVMDPDDCGDTPEDAINRAMVGRFCVCEIASSYAGPTRYGFIAPVLDPESDDEEFVHFATQQEAIDAAKARAAITEAGHG